MQPAALHPVPRDPTVLYENMLKARVNRGDAGVKRVIKGVNKTFHSKLKAFSFFTR
jgi:hypothetical protein